MNDRKKEEKHGLCVMNYGTLVCRSQLFHYLCIAIYKYWYYAT